MEPIVNKEGFAVMQDLQKARKLLNSYYSRLGYTVVAPVQKAVKAPVDAKTAAEVYRALKGK